MKILMANSFHYYRGGDCTYTFALSKLLKSRGHQVVDFAMAHPANLDSEFSNYFISQVDYDGIFKNGSLFSRLRTAPKFIYSFEAKKKIERLIRNTRPDIIHIQSIHHLLTLSILRSAKKFSLPVVWTLHDYSLVCPNTSFFRRGIICEECKGSKYYKAVLNRCRRGSASASLIVCLSSYINHWLQKSVDFFISPSLFLKNKLVEHGFSPERIIHLPYFLPDNNGFVLEQSPNTNYFIYLGRLSPEKGIETLIEAMAEVDSIQLLIAGEGPLKTFLERKAKEKNGMSIKFVGHLSKTDLGKLLVASGFVVLPSEWYENFPYAVMEAFSFGKPVVASRIGGISEQVDDQINGLFFKPGNVDDLRSKIVFLTNHPELAKKMGKQAKLKAEQEFSAQRHYENIMSIYKKLVE